MFVMCFPIIYNLQNNSRGLTWNFSYNTFASIITLILLCQEFSTKFIQTDIYFFFGFVTLNLTKKGEITWGEDLTFINIHFFLHHTLKSLKVIKDLLNLGNTLKDLKLSAFGYPMWLSKPAALNFARRVPGSGQKAVHLQVLAWLISCQQVILLSFK